MLFRSFLNNQDEGNRIQVDIENDTMTLDETSDFIYKCFVNLRLALAEKSSYYITAPKRRYLYGEPMAFLTGYVGQLTESELAQGKCGMNLNKDDLIGRSGVEETMDCSLRGDDGRRLIEVDALGKYIRELGREEPKAGNDIELSIDAYWQEKIFNLINDNSKHVIVVS